MLSQRSVGIRTSVVLCQLALVTLSYWGWLFVWQTSLFVERMILQRYAFYNEFLLVGILFSSGIKRESDGARHNWVLANRQSLRQTLAGLFSVFVVVFALHDTSVSRSFFFSYVLWLFLTLLFTNYFVPR